MKMYKIVCSIGLAIIMMPCRQFGFLQQQYAAVNSLRTRIEKKRVRPEQIFSEMKKIGLTAGDLKINEVSELNDEATDFLNQAGYVDTSGKPIRNVVNLLSVNQPPMLGKAQDQPIPSAPATRPARKVPTKTVIEPIVQVVQKQSEIRQASQQPVAQAMMAELSQSFVNNGLLVFLDDTESDENPKGKFAVMSSDLTSAILQKAGPIVASASLIANILEAKKPEEKDPQKLLQRLEDTLAKSGDLTEEDYKEKKSIYLSVVAFDDVAAKVWTIKEINASLYLLLPDNYLQGKRIDKESVKIFANQAHITQIEQQLGLKVNHMKTVTLHEIKKPLPAPEFADYFIEALWDTASNKSSLFVTNAEYPAQSKNMIPAWSIFICGHGDINHSIADLSIPQFKKFLEYLENKINTRLLFYSSCFAAGINAELIYKDAKTKIDATYPFAIITQALTDAPTQGTFLRLHLEQGKLVAKTDVAYADFLKLITSSDIINYHEAAALVTPNFQEADLGSLPQIKFPGLAWFSVLDDNKVFAIGSILAKTRTQPLNIKTFFARTTKKADPLAILLYTHDIPFELIIDIPTTNGFSPEIVSMVPGDTMHYIKKLSSITYDVDDLLNAFVLIDGLEPQKVFIIDEVTGKFSETMKDVLKDSIETPPPHAITLQNIVIKLTKEKNIIYFMYKDILYKVIGILKKENLAKAATVDDENEYSRFLTLHGVKKATTITPQLIQDLQTKAETLFAQKMTYWQAYQNIVHTLDSMPNNSALHIPKIVGAPCPAEHSICWWDSLTELQQYTTFNMHKIIWFDKIELCDERGSCFRRHRDVIIDVTKPETIIFYKDYAGKNPVSMSRSVISALVEDYVPAYTEIFKYFAEHTRLVEPSKKEIEARPVKKLLTPAAVAEIEKVQAKKAVEIEKTKAKTKN